MTKKLRLPVALAVVVMSSAACGDDAPPPEDAGPRDSAMADTGSPDAGCEPFEEYNPATMMCEPLV